ncbi:MAG: putative photosynthetic complex assembly protein PuhE [Oceanicaulis sp.]
MSLIAPILAMLALWWISTGAILVLGERSARARRTAMAAVSVLALAALVGVAALRDVATPLGAYAGAGAALVLWAWHEMSFLFGYITGPNRAQCPAETSGWAKFRAAAATLIHHEVAIAATVLVLALTSLGAQNLVALQTFALLFTLRLSSKFNLFCGAPHFTDSFLPARLAHLRSYFSDRPAGWFFAATTGAITALAGGLIYLAATAASPFETVAFALLGALAALGAIEHLFLALPVPDAALWRWLLPARDPRRSPDL